ncbi:hypothetical protein D1007_36562 [Hordeum vulgare]|nr:hypothetical protein D1007_36562 [Hordeum vulgare]KAI5020808.1 hypothetical protein ZWY2020_045696 [Hordeum vulgare]
MAATALRTICKRIGGRAIRPSPSTSRLFHSTANMHKAATTPSAEIQQVKEELYRLMSENRDKIGNQKGLIKHLAFHVEPKPEDPVWRFYCRAKWCNIAMMYSPVFLYVCMSMCEVPGSKKEMTPAEKADFNRRMSALTRGEST